MDERTVQDIAREYGPTMRELYRHLDIALKEIKVLKDADLISSPQVGSHAIQKLEESILLYKPFLKDFIQEVEAHEAYD